MATALVTAMRDMRRMRGWSFRAVFVSGRAGAVMGRLVVTQNANIWVYFTITPNPMAGA